MQRVKHDDQEIINIDRKLIYSVNLEINSLNIEITSKKKFIDKLI